MRSCCRYAMTHYLFVEKPSSERAIPHGLYTMLDNSPSARDESVSESSEELKAFSVLAVFSV